MGAICSNTDYSKPTGNAALAQNSNNNGGREKQKARNTDVFYINGEYYA